MSRPLRIQFPEAVYHVMNRGARRQSTFADDTDYQAFLDTLAQAHRLWGIEVFAYSLMGNHYHLCLRTPKGNVSMYPVKRCCDRTLPEMAEYFGIGSHSAVT